MTFASPLGAARCNPGASFVIIASGWPRPHGEWLKVWKGLIMASPSPLVSEHEPVLTVQEEPLYEIVNGQRVELPPMSVYATWLATRLQNRLGPYVEDKGLGTPATEMLFILDAEHDLRRRPDVAFVSTARWPLDRALPE